MSRAQDLFKKILRMKADKGRILAGITGDFGGHVTTGRANYIYVRTGGAVLSVYNDLVPTIPNIGVYIEETEPGNRQWRVSGTRSTAANEESAGTQLHHLSHEWMTSGAGNDVVYSHIRQFLWLRVGSMGGLTINIYPGTVTLGGVAVEINPGSSGYDMTAHKPSTSGKARWVLVCISKAGTVTFVDGSEVDISALASAAVPSGPSGCIRLAAIRMYYGQTEIMEARIASMNDIWDLRFSFAPEHHHVEHEDGGNDEISIAGLSGKAADLQNAGWIRGREVETATPGNGQAILYDQATNTYKHGNASGSINVHEVDGSPSINVTTLVVPNGTLTDDGGGTATFTPSGTGDVSGPSGATDGHLVVFDGSTGKIIKDGGAPFSRWDFHPPLATSFDLASSGTNLSLSDDNDIGLLVDGGTPETGDKNRIAYQSISKDLAWRFTAKILGLLPTTNYSGLGIGIMDSVSGRLTTLTTRGGADLNANVINWTGLTGYSGNLVGYGTMAVLEWFRIIHQSSSYSFYVSRDGKNWLHLGSAGNTSWLTNKADRVCLCIDYNRTAGGNNFLSCPYFVFEYL